MLFVDLDGFKEFNHAMGPALSDQVLIEVGRRLDACLRDEDTISRPEGKFPMKNTVLSRMGGDEFTVLLEGISDPSDAMRSAERILAAIAQTMSVEGRELHAAASIGIALSNPAHKIAEELLGEADIAMRRAKALGGARCEMFDEATHTRAVNQLKLEAELQGALTEREFRIHYQPIVQLNTKQIIGFETLLRWQHPEQGLISPGKFIEAAENAGLMVATGRWVLREACKQLRAWESAVAGMAPIAVSVNISARQFADPRFVIDLETILRETGIDPFQLNLEITEKIAVADHKLTAAVLSRLKQLKVSVTLDDFGSGNSSLLALRQFQGEGLKIDHSLMSEMLLDRGAAETIELIVGLAHRLKLKVIAEGIENARQLDHLQTLGCELGQGYFFSRPVEAKAAEELLRQPSTVMHAKVGAS